jgi:hypothetical protein
MDFAFEMGDVLVETMVKSWNLSHYGQIKEMAKLILTMDYAALRVPVFQVTILNQ